MPGPLTSIAGGMNLGFPDVCLTMVGPAPAPIPYPNISMCTMCDPASTGDNMLLDFMPSVHLMSEPLMSQGDDAGVLLGVVSHLIMGPSEFMTGIPNVLIEGFPAQTLLSVTGQNGLAENCPGTTLTPTQLTVIGM
ncbi:DUF4150 domain-containing protein [Candidatus Methylospira mobilis]|uniref:DUF4150 domain-containing protein n=1 Tax=Candidatus Methylospira mobilis TaxID=1808979 RepID=A0A5Q0BHH2_9GAMM|nr:DUF4150 domain-containing protein [Candidatus Methylospira mobilis]QFY41578.1 DUF4150 domain-containing protein [Candidatus Methylospira mobilis]WNV05180.1 DUF4150 domain-containing protein [Candidatus Methylospira mobilis]